jgi:DNA-binding PadR family transcriptional regulator
VDKGYIQSKEEIIEGRANKFFFITELGRKYLEELKLKWANVFSIMSEFRPSKGLRMILIENINEFKNKDDAIDFFRGLRSWMKGMLKRIQSRINNFKQTQGELNRIIEEIEKMDDLNKEKIIQMVEESIKKREAINRNA